MYWVQINNSRIVESSVSFAIRTMLFLFIFSSSLNILIGQHTEYVLDGCTIYPMDSEQIIQDGYIHVKNGKIHDLGRGSIDSVKGQELNLRGTFAVPLFIDLHRESRPTGRGVRDALHSGVGLIVLRQPPDHLFGGWSKLIRILPDSAGGPVTEDEQVDFQFNFKSTVDSNPQKPYDPPFFKQKYHYFIRELLGSGPVHQLENIPKHNSLQTYLKKDGNIYFYVETINDILFVNQYIQQNKLNAYIGGISRVTEVLEQLSASAASMMVLGPSLYAIHSRSNSPYIIPLLLSEQLTDFAIATYRDTRTSLNLLDQVRLLTSHGISTYEALKTVTVNPAKAIHNEEWSGTIQRGQEANILIFDRDPMHIQSKVRMVISKGKIVYLP